MIVVRKKYVTDENHNPIAVQIDYEDWLEIERLLRRLAIENRPVNVSQFVGKLKAELSEHPVAYQQRIRDEWS